MTEVAHASVGRFINKSHTTVMAGLFNASKDEIMIGQHVVEKIEAHRIAQASI